jgi:hypothetical protein
MDMTLSRRDPVAMTPRQEAIVSRIEEMAKPDSRGVAVAKGTALLVAWAVVFIGGGGVVAWWIVRLARWMWSHPLF